MTLAFVISNFSTYNILHSFLADDHLVFAVVLGNHHLDKFIPRGRQILSHIIRSNRQFPVSSVNQRRQLNAARPAALEDGIHCCPHRPAGVDDIVHQDDLFSLHRKRQTGSVLCGLVLAFVIAVSSDVQHPDLHLSTLQLINALCHPLCQLCAAGHDTDNTKIPRALVALDDFKGDAGDCPRHRLLVHDLGLFDQHIHPPHTVFPPCLRQ